MLDQSFEQPALLGRKLVVVESDVAQEHHVKSRQRIQSGGELLDVVFGAAADLAEPGTTRCGDSGTPNEAMIRRPAPAVFPRESRSARLADYYPPASRRGVSER